VSRRSLAGNLDERRRERKVTSTDINIRLMLDAAQSVALQVTAMITLRQARRSEN
jgi:hypothetical protein